MRSPLIAGTLIHNRYSIIQLLGQGGFARTYLAQDQGRFNELCVLKELIPTQNSRMAVEKARELFEREATILYQVRHPQIPLFRASFEYEGTEGPRLFLVQDYVAGKTYRQLLSDRKSKGEVFSEADVRSLLVQILPVLDYLHNQGIIHRDVSPENVILRQSDRQPVLIDFGVVKEMVTRWQEASGPYPATTVGKLGFSPMEQLQTGRVYPSSDLYSLAVTVVVLLTGQEPQELLEDRTATWRWHRWAAVSPELAAILDRMLLYRPGDRFGSASEVLAAMQSLPAPVAPAIAQPAALQSQFFAEGATMGWESSVMPVPPTLPSESHLPMPKGARSYPWRVMGLGAVLALMVATTSVLTLMFSGRLSSTKPTGDIQDTDQGLQAANPDPSRQALPSFSFPPSLTSFPAPKPKLYTQALMLRVPEKTTVSGTLEQNQVIDYQLLGELGQSLKLTLSNTPDVAMTIQTPDQLTLPGPKPGSTQSLNLLSGQYILRLKLRPPVKEQTYRLGIDLQPAAVSTASSISKPLLAAKSLPAGKIRKFSGWVNPGRPKRYLVRGQAGQVLTAVIVDGSVTLNLRSPSGQPIKNAYGLGDWKGKLTTTGNYQIEIMAFAPTAYKLNLSLRNPR
ncbi:MAG: serine/threonine protein kinase [Aphanocapsa sp. GSE-SYN-MK-11-07L]|jgi:serine/threonine-protein kinase|nr:serine/threonine protein kinase [Aphanocapsa sp. GSE-SYN-MK-11-07L]